MAENRRTLLVVQSDIAPDLESDFLRWYDEEHIPQRLAVPGFRGATRFVAGPPPVSGSGLEVAPPPRHLAIYEVDGLHVLSSEPYQRLIASPTEWTRKIRSTFNLKLRHPYLEQFTLTPDDPRVSRFR